VVERLKEEHNVDVDWRPYYLRPDTPPEGMELPEYIKQARTDGSEERLRAMANMYGMNFKSTERIYNTRLAHESTEFARAHGKGNEFHKIVFRQIYAEGLDISKWDVLRASAKEAGLDADEMQREVDSDKFRMDVANQVRWAWQIGVTGVPTYVINDRYALVGAQPYEAFKKTLEKIANQKD
jgi:predicted DsbA family dithiol-disulfide isomerase